MACEKIATRTSSQLLSPAHCIIMLQLHQNTMAKEEFEALAGVRDQRAASGDGAANNAACLLAAAPSGEVPHASPVLRLDGSGETVVGGG